MLSTVKNDPDWEGQIEIKYENMPEYINTKEIKEESANCQEFEIKIENCSVDEDYEDLPQECIKDQKDINQGDHENFGCSDDESSIGILGSKDAMDYQYSGYNCDDVANLDDHVMVAHNGENKCSVHQNIPPSNLVPPTSNLSGINLRKHERVKVYKHCDFESPQMSTITCHSLHTKKEKCTEHRKEKIHKCHYCDYGSPRMSNLKSHVNYKHTREKIHKCQYCDYGSPLLSHLKSHINSRHTRKKLHKCEYCDYEISEISSLKRHINSIHTREKIHKCQYCNYRNPNSLNLKRHINSKHTREKLHKCEYCDYGYPEISTLKSHINTKHTREEVHKCEYCDYESPDKSNLKRHINSKHTRENLHKCLICDYRSPIMSHLKRHIKRKHTEVRREDHIKVNVQEDIKTLEDIDIQM